MLKEFREFLLNLTKITLAYYNNKYKLFVLNQLSKTLKNNLNANETHYRMVTGFNISCLEFYTLKLCSETCRLGMFSSLKRRETLVLSR